MFQLINLRKRGMPKARQDRSTDHFILKECLNQERNVLSIFTKGCFKARLERCTKQLAREECRDVLPLYLYKRKIYSKVESFYLQPYTEGTLTKSRNILHECENKA